LAQPEQVLCLFPLPAVLGSQDDEFNLVAAALRANEPCVPIRNGQARPHTTQAISAGSGSTGWPQPHAQFDLGELISFCQNGEQSRAQLAEQE
jgi:hypothetical protein